MATMYDVARLAGVSIATVSAVVNGTAYVSPELTKRVREAIDDLDYTINHLAHSFQTRRTKTVGMLIPEGGSPDPFYGEVVRGAEDVLRGEGYLLILGHTYNDVTEQSRYLGAFRSRFVDGVLLFQAPGDDEELQTLIRERPIVFVGRQPSGVEADVVATDIALGTRLGVQHLISRGHERIALLTIESSMSVRDLRYRGWRSALQRAGLPADKTLVATGRLTADSAEEQMETLLGLAERPTAVFVDNLVMVTGVLRALHKRGLSCPRDLEIVSSDDAEWLDVFQPPISTIVQPSYELGARSAQLLLERMAQPNDPKRKIVLKPTLRPREGEDSQFGGAV